MQIGDIITVSYEESRKLRKQGYRPCNDIVVMMYVGKPDESVKSNKTCATTAWPEWAPKMMRKADALTPNREVEATHG